MSSPKDITLLLVGRTGNGKSTTGNTILNHFSPASGGAAGKFSVAHSLNSDTRICEEEECHRGTQKITVINTPDLANVPAVGKTEKRSEEEISKEIEKWAAKIKQTKAAVLLVIRCNKPYSMEEYEVYKQLTQDKSFDNNLVVVFTMGGFLNGRDLRTDLVDANKELLEVMDNAGWRYVVFGDVRKADDLTKAACVNTLMEIVDSMKPHPFPQQICRLLVTGAAGGKMDDLLGMLQSVELTDKVQFLRKTTEDGLRIEVTLCAEDVLRKHSEAVTTALCPGPHAILCVGATSNLKTTLRKALGEQGSLQIKSSGGNVQLDVVNFIVDVDKLAGKRDLKKVLEEVKKVAWKTFYMTEVMKNASDEVQTCIDNCQATYEDYMRVKKEMIRELISKVA